MTTKRYAVPQHFINWLEAEEGRSAYFQRIDPGLFPPIISKMKAGVTPITFEYACRLVRAQKPSATPLEAESLMTFNEHRALYRFVTGQDPAPAPVEVIRQTRASARKDLTQAGA